MRDVEQAVAVLNAELDELSQLSVRLPLIEHHPCRSHRIVAEIGKADKIEDAEILSWAAQNRMVLFNPSIFNSATPCGDFSC